MGKVYLKTGYDNEMEMDIQEELLEKVGKGGIQRNVGNWNYNIFKALKIHAKEVIMCRFLADLLKTNGDNKKIEVLRSFCEDILGEQYLSDTLLENTLIHCEYPINEKRRIDIVIENRRFFIPIEVKIYADEQESQCFDYYEYAKKYYEDVKVIYLTRFAAEPSQYSRKKLSLEKIKCIGWNKDIVPWLKKVKAFLDNKTVNIVEQYIEAIYSFADESENIIMEQTVNIINEKEEYFSAALDIEKNIKYAKVKLLKEVFKEFEVQMKPLCERYGLKREEREEYYEYYNMSEKYYDNAQSTYPGLNYVVEKADIADNNIKLWFRIEVDYQLFAGFALYDMFAQGENEKGYEVNEITKDMYSFAEKYLDGDCFIRCQGWWLTFVYPNGSIEGENYKDVPDFKRMNDCAVSLVNTAKRVGYVKKSLEIFEEKLLKRLK